MTPEQIRQQLCALDFAQTELVLYLDVHPEDDAARTQWQRNAAEVAALTQQHIRLTGTTWPLVQNRDGGALAWVASPWPWDNQ